MNFKSWGELSGLDREVLWKFMSLNAGEARGKILDYGCGKQPYRELLERYGEYHPYDRTDFPDSQAPVDVGDDLPLLERWDTIVCNEMISLVDDPQSTIASFRKALNQHGRLILTYKMSWIQYHPQDRWRFTPSGMESMLWVADFEVIHHESGLVVQLAPNYPLHMGYGVVAEAI